jgi:histidine triad (HIT) family protein
MTGEFDPDCDFCQIANGTQDAIAICESANCLAFFPDDPAVAGHTLVIPRRHVTDLWEVDGQLRGDLMDMVIRVGRALEAALTPEGMNLITSAGEAASQTVFHLHLHVVPRWLDDRIGSIWPPAKHTSERIKEGIADLVRAQC